MEDGGEGLQDKVALVTGGAAGIGRATCLELARQGASVAVVDLDARQGSRTAEHIRDLGGHALSLSGDVTQANHVKRCVAEAIEAFGRIDIVFNNAGVEGVVLPTTDYPEDVFDKVMAVNVRGVFLGMKYVLPLMTQQRSGSIINTSSMVGLQGSAGFSAYVASKHAVIGLTRVAAAEVARYGVRVNAVCPGNVHTRMMRSIEGMAAPDDPQVAMERFAAQSPAGRYGDPEEVARVVAFLASDAASFVNGAAWAIDGGATAV